MRDYVITTDNNSDLPEEYYKEHGVGCTYLSYSMDGKNYTHGNFLPDHEFYEAMRKGSLPATAQVNPDDARALIEPYLKEGKDVSVFATGLCVNEAREAEKLLAADGIDAEIINIHTIKPLDEKLVLASAAKTGKVVTIEEHSVIGGLGSAVCDVLSEKQPTKVMKIGINDVFGESGPALELIQKYGLDAQSIYEKVKAFVKQN